MTAKPIVQTSMFDVPEKVTADPLRGKVLHACVSIDIDRFDDAKIERDWLPSFPKTKPNGLRTTVADIRATCIFLRRNGFKVFPHSECTNVKPNGHCGGCDK